MKLGLRPLYRFAVLVLVAIVVLEANYWTLLPKLKITNNMIRLLWLIMLFVPLIFSVFRMKFIRPHLIWILFLGFVLINNAQFAHGKSNESYEFFLCVMVFFVCTYDPEWTKKAPAVILIIGLPNLIATILFYINSGLYETFIARTYKEYQNGTFNGLYGYRAGLAGHYSHNGTYLAIVMIVLFCILFCVKISKPKKIIVIGAALAAIYAIFMTTKRAHLLFGGAVVIAIYYIANRESMSRKMTRTLLIVGGVASMGGIIIELVPAISQTLDRLSKAGSDGASQYRFKMWDYALSHVFEKPFFGHGWFSFTFNQEIANVDGAANGTHNVYVQMLYDIGIIGFVVAVSALLITFIITMRSLIAIKKSNPDYLLAISVSLAVQLFFIMYGFTGNFLYDSSFLFYAAAVAISFGIKANLPKILAGSKTKTEGGPVGPTLPIRNHV